MEFFTEAGGVPSGEAPVYPGEPVAEFSEQEAAGFAITSATLRRLAEDCSHWESWHSPKVVVSRHIDYYDGLMAFAIEDAQPRDFPGEMSFPSGLTLEFLRMGRWSVCRVRQPNPEYPTVYMSTGGGRYPFCEAIKRALGWAPGSRVITVGVIDQPPEEEPPPFSMHSLWRGREVPMVSFDLPTIAQTGVFDGFLELTGLAAMSLKCNNVWILGGALGEIQVIRDIIGYQGIPFSLATCRFYGGQVYVKYERPRDPVVRSPRSLTALCWDQVRVAACAGFGDPAIPRALMARLAAAKVAESKTMTRLCSLMPEGSLEFTGEIASIAHRVGGEWTADVLKAHYWRTHADIEAILQEDIQAQIRRNWS